LEITCCLLVLLLQYVCLTILVPY